MEKRASHDEKDVVELTVDDDDVGRMVKAAASSGTPMTTRGVLEEPWLWNRLVLSFMIEDFAVSGWLSSKKKSYNTQLTQSVVLSVHQRRWSRSGPVQMKCGNFRREQ